MSLDACLEAKSPGQRSICSICQALLVFFPAPDLQEEDAMPRGPSRPHPPTRLLDALEVPRAIGAYNAGKPMNRILLAEAIKLSPTSSGFRDRIMASYRYGLTEGNYKSESISLTSVGEAIGLPRDDNERVLAERAAFGKVPIFAKLLQHFANAKVPESGFLKNTLERAPFSVEPAWSEEIAQLFIQNARDVGYLRDMGGNTFLVVDTGTALSPEVQPDGRNAERDESDEEGQSEQSPTNIASTMQMPDPETARSTAPDRPKPVQVFVAHGRSQKPLEQLRKILNEWQVPFVVAVDEANAGRPISEKVAELMKSCSAGIFIFSADEQFTDSSGNTICRPSQNVVYELGAAGLLYGRKIVVFRESGVTFPSDFSDLGWIEFQRDALDAKAMDLLRELIALKAVRLVSSTAD